MNTQIRKPNVLYSKDKKYVWGWIYLKEGKLWWSGRYCYFWGAKNGTLKYKITEEDHYDVATKTMAKYDSGYFRVDGRRFSTTIAPDFRKRLNKLKVWLALSCP